jgi:hypothetical protein
MELGQALSVVKSFLKGMEKLAPSWWIEVLELQASPHMFVQQVAFASVDKSTGTVASKACPTSLLK